MGCLIAFMMFFFIGSMFYISPILGFLIIGGVIFFIYKCGQDEKEEKRIKKEEFIRNINKYKERYGMPETTQIINSGDCTCINESISNKTNYIWKENDQLIFLNTDFTNDYGQVKLEINKVEFYNRVGDFYTTTKVNGGGSDIGGAVAGAVIAGEAGAMIGSRQEVNSKTVEVDKRQTLMCINKDGEEEYAYFNSQAYEIFIKLIPSKEI